MIWMHPPEFDEIYKHLNKDDVMLEYGAGGSTIDFSKKVKKYYSIEHNEQWYNDIKKQIENKKLDNVNLYHVKNDLPRSFPHVKFEEFKTYILYVHKLGLKYGPFNKVLIDGRARIWCAQHILQYITLDSIVFLHDWAERKQYHSVLSRYDLIKVVDRLAVLKKKVVE